MMCRRIASRSLVFVWWLAVGLLAVLSARATHAETRLRVGHFPNITLAQALVAHSLSRRGVGWFEERLGPGIHIE